jgi:hypothetical protein
MNEKQVNWKLYKKWYQTVKHTAFLFDENEPVVFGDVDNRPDDEPYVHIRQNRVSSWMPARFVIESEVSE